MIWVLVVEVRQLMVVNLGLQDQLEPRGGSNLFHKLIIRKKHWSLSQNPGLIMLVVPRDLHCLPLRMHLCFEHIVQMSLVLPRLGIRAKPQPANCLWSS